MTIRTWDAARRLMAIDQYEQATTLLKALIIDPELPGTLVPLVQADLAFAVQHCRSSALSRLARWWQGRRVNG